MLRMADDERERRRILKSAAESGVVVAALFGKSTELK